VPAKAHLTLLSAIPSNCRAILEKIPCGVLSPEIYRRNYVLSQSNLEALLMLSQDEFGLATPCLEFTLRNLCATGSKCTPKSKSYFGVFIIQSILEIHF